MAEKKGQARRSSGIPSIRSIGIHASDGETLEVSDSVSITIEDKARVKIIITPKENSKIKIHTGEHCEVETFILNQENKENENPSPSFSFELTNHIASGSLVRTNGFWCSGADARISSLLEGAGAEAHDTNIFIEDDDSKLHLDSELVHKAKNTKGDILIKGVVKVKGSVKLDGMIRVEKEGKGAESFLAEHVILMNPGAHASANPELEIKNNDVSSRHSASVSQIDENKIFYLMTRGLPREDAKKLIVEGFLSSALMRINEEKERNALENAILRSL